MAPQADRYYLEKKSWEEKAQSNPLYAVMSVDEFVVSGSTPNQEELTKFYTAGNIKVRKWIHPWLLETETKPEMKILEFGCGMGRLLKSLSEFHPPENLYGVDISKTMISHAKKNLPRAIMLSCLKEDATFPYPDSYFDRVYS